MAIFLAPRPVAAQVARGLFSLTRVGVTRVVLAKFWSVILGPMAPQTMKGICTRLNTGSVASATGLFQWPMAATTSRSLTSLSAADTPVCGSEASSSTTPSTLNGTPAVAFHWSMASRKPFFAPRPCCALPPLTGPMKPSFTVDWDQAAPQASVAAASARADAARRRRDGRRAVVVVEACMVGRSCWVETGRHGAWRACRRCLATPPDQCIAASDPDWIAFSEAAPRQKRRRFCAVSCFNVCVTRRPPNPNGPPTKRNPIDA